MDRPRRRHLRRGDDTHPVGYLEPALPGWFYAAGEGFPPVYLGCARDHGTHAVVITALLAGRAGRLSTADLRALPLGRLESLLQQEDLRGWALQPGHGAGPAALHEQLLASRGGKIAHSHHEEDQAPQGETRPALTRPGARVTNEFLAEVALRYRDLAQRTNKPTWHIAQEAQVPLTTARRWVGMARRHGLLGPGQKGRAVS